MLSPQAAGAQVSVMGPGDLVFLNSSHVFIVHGRYFGSQSPDTQMPYLTDQCPYSTDAKEVLYDPVHKEVSEGLVGWTQ